MDKIREITIGILDMFEEVLEEHDIYIPDEHRTGDESEACLYGATYYELEDRIYALLSETIQN